MLIFGVGEIVVGMRLKGKVLEWEKGAGTPFILWIDNRWGWGRGALWGWRMETHPFYYVARITGTIWKMLYF
ncbi:hypothetical protein CULC809_01743 [Corynebacterium ulcerans 809]|nr:hypothetical protein CULC809_01743 [Corynebacterium ulcerans 809]